MKIYPIIFPLCLFGTACSSPPAPQPPPTIPGVYAPTNGFASGSLFVPEPRRPGSGPGPLPNLPLHPKLRWDPVPDAVRYEVQMTRECSASGYGRCAFDELDIDESIDSASIEEQPYSPELALPVNIPRSAAEGPGGSRYYWRVRACPETGASGGMGTVPREPTNEEGCWDWSPVRYLFVGRDDHDYNGDGYADLIVGAAGTGQDTDGNEVQGGAFIYFGGEDGIGETPDVSLSPGSGASSDDRFEDLVYGHDVGSGRDLNGDGYADVLVGAIGRNEEATGAVFVHFGSAAGPSPTADLVLRPEGQDAHFGWRVIGAGDLDADGYADIAVASAGVIGDGDEPGGAVSIFYGSTAGPSERPDTVITNPSDRNPDNASFATSIDGGGDVNGDGFTDLVVGAPRQEEEDRNGNVSSVGAAMVFFGPIVMGSAGTVLPLRSIRQADGRFGDDVACDGDIDGDGYADVFATAPNQVRPHEVHVETYEPMYIFLGIGAPSGAHDDIREWTRPSAAPIKSILGYIGDVAGAGFSAVFVRSVALRENPISDRGVQWRQEWVQGDGGEARSPDDEHGLSFGSAVTGVDLNADGYSDIVIANVAYGETTTDEGRVYIFAGAPPNSLPPDPQQTLQSPADGPFRFGASLD